MIPMSLFHLFTVPLLIIRCIASALSSTVASSSSSRVRMSSSAVFMVRLQWLAGAPRGGPSGCRAPR